MAPRLALAAKNASLSDAEIELRSKTGKKDVDKMEQNNLAADDDGTLTVCIVTLPFDHEGEHRMERAIEGKKTSTFFFIIIVNLVLFISML